ncbi:hypothetical protein ACLBKU_13960 [Erythrobacter sp. NE805]|uniref:hypothetical protein n=1 Tax=Erythrobacter sp. NE805 TaxID=3389875 RepID=UPI00396B1550
MTKKNTVPDAEWERQGRLLELGVKHASQIAMELGVSAQTVSRELKRRGYRKNALLHRSVEEIERYHTMKARQRAIMHLPEARRRQIAAKVTMEALAGMMQAIIQADMDGDITKANVVIEPLAAAVGVKFHGKRRRA